MHRPSDAGQLRSVRSLAPGQDGDAQAQAGRHLQLHGRPRLYVQAGLRHGAGVGEGKYQHNVLAFNQRYFIYSIGMSAESGRVRLVQVQVRDKRAVGGGSARISAEMQPP